MRDLIFDVTYFALISKLRYGSSVQCVSEK